MTYELHSQQMTRPGVVVIGHEDGDLPIIHVLDGVLHWAGGPDHHTAMTDELAQLCLDAARTWDYQRLNPEDQRVTIQLEPERVKRLLEVLRSAGAHPSGLGSYEAANDANMLADDIELMVNK